MGVARSLCYAALIIASAAKAQPIKPVGKLRPYTLSTVTASTLAMACYDSREGDAIQLDRCTAYILGVADSVKIAGGFCLEGDAFTLQIVTVVRRYIRDNPKRWDTHGYFMVKEALEKAFPCPAK